MDEVPRRSIAEVRRVMIAFRGSHDHARYQRPEVQTDAEPDTPLLWVLRDHLGMTGSKFGCGKALCGACTVHIDGKPTRSCVLPVSAAPTSKITTIEGVGKSTVGKAVQDAWIAEDVPQCGYCQSGQIMSATALLDNQQEADRRGHRCGDGRQRLPLRHLCAHPLGDQARRRHAGLRSTNMSAAENDRTDSRHPSRCSARRRRADGRMLAAARRRRDANGEPKAQRRLGTFAPNAFVRIGADNTVTVLSKHVEMGQGAYTGLATIVAEELDADWKQVRVEGAPADAKLYSNLAFGPFQGTGGSTAIANSYDQLRKAGATARAMLVTAAAKRWKVPASEITVANGVVQHKSGKSARFGELVADAAKLPVPTDVKLKDPCDLQAASARTRARVDSRDKSTGKATFTQDIKLPGMLTAVVAPPPRFGAKVKSFDAAKAKAIKGVKSVVAFETPARSGVAVLATDFWSAKKGRDALTVEWDESAAFKQSSAEMLQEYRELAQAARRFAQAGRRCRRRRSPRPRGRSKRHTNSRISRTRRWSR